MSNPLPRDTVKKLFIACDHAGLPLKEKLIAELPELPWDDLGTYSKDSVDYPDFADKLCRKIADETTFGVLICGSGQGMCMRANRYNHIRAALCWNEEITRLSRSHNDANVLCLGARTIDFRDAEKFLLVFLDTAFEGGRHETRVEKLWALVE